jgi:nucleoid-associated protein YgaU
METMDDYRTEPFEPEPDPAYDDWGDYEDPRPKILWGRVAVLGGAMLIAFLVGRALAPDGIPPSQLTRAEGQRDDLQAQVDQLSTELRQTQRQLTQLQNSPPPAETEEKPAPKEEEPTIYEVKPGDTLLGLAQEFYDDPELSVLIAEANNMKSTAQLNVGDQLIIPPKPD